MSVEHKGIQEWVKTFVKNTNLSGLVCFDFLVDKDDNVYCIECNPRLHSAIVSFESQTKVSNTYFKNYVDKMTWVGGQKMPILVHVQGKKCPRGGSPRGGR